MNKRNDNIKTINNEKPFDLFSTSIWQNQQRKRPPTPTQWISPKTTIITKIKKNGNSDMLQIVQHLLVTCLLRDYETTPTQIPIPTPIPTQVSSGIKSGTNVIEFVAGQPHLTAKPMEPTMEKTTEMLKTEIELDDVVEEAADNVEEDEDDQEHLQKKKPRLESTAITTSMTLKEKTAAQITDAELLCLPKNCVLYKVLHLQLLAKVSKQQQHQ